MAVAVKRPKVKSNGAREASRVRTLSQDEVREQLDKRSRRALGISGAEFLRRYRQGELEYSPKEIQLATLADLVV